MGYCNTKDRTIYSIIKNIQTYKGIFTMDIDTLIMIARLQRFYTLRLLTGRSMYPIGGSKSYGYQLIKFTEKIYRTQALNPPSNCKQSPPNLPHPV